jgi:AcrR family transcriptional regulator
MLPGLHTPWPRSYSGVWYKVVVDSGTGVRYGTRPMTAAPVAARPGGEPPTGLRERKKLRTRLAIQSAALELFGSQGYDTTTVDEIAAAAEVSTTTFFTYFPTKADVVVGDQTLRLPELERAIVDSAADIDDFDALRQAIEAEWLTGLDPELTWRKARAVAGSHALRGVTVEIGEQWIRGIADALARRHDRDTASEADWLTARLALTLLNHAFETWMFDDHRGELVASVDHAFTLAATLSRGWTS